MIEDGPVFSDLPSGTFAAVLLDALLSGTNERPYQEHAEGVLPSTPLGPDT